MINMAVLNQVLVGYTKQHQLQDESQIIHHHQYSSNNILISDADTMAKNLRKNIPSHCLSLDEDDTMDAILQTSRPVMITMPAKASGTSLKTFANSCTNFIFEGNFINNANKIRAFLTHSLKLPAVIASHSYRDDPLIALIKQLGTKSLIVYVHRDETDRLKSGIEHYIRERACRTHQTLQYNGTHCIMDEDNLISIIGTRKHEIGTGVHDILTCDTFDSIEENFPNIVFIHYTQVNKLQNLIAKHHCPQLLDHPVVINVAKDKSLTMTVRLAHQKSKSVSLSEWLNEKIDFLEWSLNLKNDVGCQAQLRHIEEKLFSCPDQTFKPSISDIKNIMG